jgi:hypothetical protein
MKEELSPGLMLQRYLMASYLYYIRDVSIVSDHTYDRWAKELLKNWKKLKHRHKHLLDESDLECGTGFGIKEKDYPSIIKYAALAWADRENVHVPKQPVAKRKKK